MPVCVLALTGTISVSPPHSSERRFNSRGKLLFDAVGVGVGLVNLVQGHDHRHVRRMNVGIRLARGGHHAVVRCHHQHGNVRALRPARAHGGERLMAGVSRKVIGWSLCVTW